MKIDIPYKFGQSVYLKNDLEQHEYLINRIILEPGRKVVLELMNGIGEFIEVQENLIRPEKDVLKTLDINKKEEGEE